MNEVLKNKFKIIVEAVHPTIPNANGWGCSESRSGGGSTIASTQNLRNELPKLFSEFSIKSILDIPCGDFNWMKEVDLTGIEYTGSDILEIFVEENTAKYPMHQFLHLDLTEDPLPKKDLIIVRDCFIHFSYENIFKSLQNIKLSGSKYLLVSSNMDFEINRDVPDSDVRQLNMLIEPFFLKPIAILNEDNARCMLLIKIEDLT